MFPADSRSSLSAPLSSSSPSTAAGPPTLDAPVVGAATDAAHTGDGSPTRRQQRLNTTARTSNNDKNGDVSTGDSTSAAASVGQSPLHQGVLVPLRPIFAVPHGMEHATVTAAAHWQGPICPCTMPRPAAPPVRKNYRGKSVLLCGGRCVTGPGCGGFVNTLLLIVAISVYWLGIL